MPFVRQKHAFLSEKWPDRQVKMDKNTDGQVKMDKD